MFLKLIIILCIVCVQAEQFADGRCRCICPSANSIFPNTDSKRMIYIATAPAHECNCEGVVLPNVEDVVKDNAKSFCPRCKCKYETQNPKRILVVVIVIVRLIMMLIIYYFFMIVLENFFPEGPLNIFASLYYLLFDEENKDEESDDSILMNEDDMEEPT